MGAGMSWSPMLELAVLPSVAGMVECLHLPCLPEFPACLFLACDPITKINKDGETKRHSCARVTGAASRDCVSIVQTDFGASTPLPSLQASSISLLHLRSLAIIMLADDTCNHQGSTDLSSF